VNVSVLQKAISSNHTEFGGREPNGCRVLEVGINKASILISDFDDPAPAAKDLIRKLINNIVKIILVKIWIFLKYPLPQNLEKITPGQMAHLQSSAF
jgi:hypothetical protein